MSIWKKTNAEIKEFMEDTNIQEAIYKACWKARLRNADWDLVRNEMAIKFAKGKIDYDPSKGAKYSTFIFEVARNYAKDMIRREHSERFQDMENEDWEKIGDEHDCNDEICAKEDRILVKEAIRRLSKDIRDKKKFLILLRYVLNGEDREALAKEYHVGRDYVSLVKNRYLPRLRRHVREVLQEDERDELKLVSQMDWWDFYLNR